MSIESIMTALGYVVANWIGYGASFSTTTFQWRFPLAMQIVFALLVLFAAPFLPGIASCNESSFYALTYLPRIASMAHRERRRRYCLCAGQETPFHWGEHQLYPPAIPRNARPDPRGKGADRSFLQGDLEAARMATTGVSCLWCLDRSVSVGHHSGQFLP